MCREQQQTVNGKGSGYLNKMLWCFRIYPGLKKWLYCVVLLVCIHYNTVLYLRLVLQSIGLIKTTAIPDAYMFGLFVLFLLCYTTLTSCDSSGARLSNLKLLLRYTALSLKQRKYVTMDYICQGDKGNWSTIPYSIRRIEKSVQIWRGGRRTKR